MSIDDALASLTSELEPEVTRLLRRAYELGYREGLASVPETAKRREGSEETIHSAEAALHPETPGPAEVPSVRDADAGTSSLFVSGSYDEVESEKAEDEDDDGYESEGEEVDANDHAARRTRRRRKRGIRSSASIGTLLRKIHKDYKLERFDIEVVICRPEDKSRRQLRTDIPLRTYLRED